MSGTRSLGIEIAIFSRDDPFSKRSLNGRSLKRRMIGYIIIDPERTYRRAIDLAEILPDHVRKDDANPNRSLIICQRRDEIFAKITGERFGQH
jgi:hypothetical protein